MRIAPVCSVGNLVAQRQCLPANDSTLMQTRLIVTFIGSCVTWFRTNIVDGLLQAIPAPFRFWAPGMRICGDARLRGGRGYCGMAAAAGLLFFAPFLEAQSGSADVEVTTLAGLAGISGSTDGTGSAARFNWTRSVAVDTSGNIYVTDTKNDTIRKIAPGGVVTTFAGSAGSQGSIDDTGSAARFYGPRGVAVDGSGNVYVADT